MITLDMALPYLRLAREQAVLQGEIPFEGFPRLLQELTATDGLIYYQLQWRFWPASSLAYAQGALTTQLPLTCQRCLQPLCLSVDAALHWVFVQSQAEADLLPEAIEAIYPEDAMQVLSLRYLLEDSLLLLLPLFPSHTLGDCQGLAAITQERPQSFAALAALKTLKKDQ